MPARSRFGSALVRLSALATIACAGALSPAALEARRQEVLARERAFAATITARDHRAFTTFLSVEATFFPRGRILRGRDAVAAEWKRYYDGPRAPFAWAPDGAEVLPSGELAATTGPVFDPAGKVIARFNSIWRREAGGVWRVVFDKGSPVCGGDAK